LDRIRFFASDNIGVVNVSWFDRYCAWISPEYYVNTTYSHASLRNKSKCSRISINFERRCCFRKTRYVKSKTLNYAAATVKPCAVNASEKNVNTGTALIRRGKRTEDAALASRVFRFLQRELSRFNLTCYISIVRSLSYASFVIRRIRRAI